MGIYHTCNGTCNCPARAERSVKSWSYATSTYNTRRHATRRSELPALPLVYTLLLLLSLTPTRSRPSTVFSCECGHWLSAITQGQPTERRSARFDHRANRRSFTAATSQPYPPIVVSTGALGYFESFEPYRYRPFLALVAIVRLSEIVRGRRSYRALDSARSELYE